MSKKNMLKKFANPVCQECIKQHLKKYDKFVDEQGKRHDGFTLPCGGIPTEYISEKMRVLLGNEELIEQAEQMLDPVRWAVANIKTPAGTPWVARWYQEVMLRCTATRRVTRCGRRIGKSDTICIHALHYLFTNKNKHVLVIAPYKSQTEEIFGRIRNFLVWNPDLQRSVVKDVSSPYYRIDFQNGSSIRGFSSGTKSGAEAAGVRGQDADRIYLDEADYLDEGDLKAIAAILMTKPDTQLWSSSTPTGRRSHFWRWCTQMPTYKEFHYSSEVLPFWDEIKEQIKADYAGSVDGWTHEIMADWGEETVGVFQHGHVDPAETDYKYENQIPTGGWIYSMGVDWNTNFGTEIVVVGFNGGNMFRVVDAINIPKQGWTQLAGVEGVLHMNQKWKPSFVYVDEGAGNTNIELLQKYSFDVAAKTPADPATMLRHTLKAYNFSAKIEARDPLTKTPIKKHAKPFMVENAVRFFEEGKIQISAYDALLRQQLGNYIIKHRTEAGVPVYSVTDERIGDHRLDALMLALVAYKLEMSDFGKPKYLTNIGISPGFSHFADKKNSYDPSKEMEKRLERMPKERVLEPGDKSIFDQKSQLPGVVESETGKVPEYRHGFMTDEEDKLKAIYRLRNLKRRGSASRRTRPSRSNI